MNRSLSWTMRIDLANEAERPLLAFARQNQRVEKQVEKSAIAISKAHETSGRKVEASTRRTSAAIESSTRGVKLGAKAFDQMTDAEKRASIATDKLAQEKKKLQIREVNLSRDLERARAATQRQTAATEDQTRKVSKLDQTLGKAAKRLIALGAAYASIQGAKDALAVTEELGKTTMGLAGNFGFATDEASRWAAQLKIRGIDAGKASVSFNSLTKNIAAVAAADKKRGRELAALGTTEKDQEKRAKLMGKSLGAQADAFKRLGLSTREVKAGSKDFGGFLYDVADGMAEIEDKADRNALGLKLFGRQWQTLRPLLSGGSGALREQLEMADRYGITLTDASQKGLGDMIAAQREWKFALLGVQVQMGKVLMPLMQRFATYLPQIADSVRKNWPQVREQIAPVVDVLAGVAKAAASLVQTNPGLIKVGASLLALGVAVKAITFAGQITGITRLIGLHGKLRGAATASAAASTAAAAAGSAGAGGPVGPAGRAAGAGRALLGRVGMGAGIAGVGYLGASAVGAAVGGGTGKTIATVGGSAAIGAGVGSLAGPVGMLAGATIGGLVGAFRRQGTARAERAAREFAEQAKIRTDAATAAGFARPAATRLGRATAGLQAGQNAVRDYRRGEQLQASASFTDRAEGSRLIQQAKQAAKGANLDINALLKGNSNAFKRYGQEAVAAYGQGIRTGKFTDGRTLLARFTQTLGAATPEVRKQGAQTMLEYARSLERQGKVAEGTTDKLARTLARKFGIVVDGADRSGKGAAAALDRALRDRRLSSSADKLVRDLGNTFENLPTAAVRSVPGAVAILGANLDKLKRIARDKDAPSAMRERAEKALPELQRQYDRSLGRMAKRLGISEDQARTWASRQRAAAKKAGGGTTDVDTLKDAVGRLNRNMSNGAADALRLEDALRKAGVSARNAAAIVSVTETIKGLGIPGLTSPPTGRKGGTLTRTGFRRYQGGGLVPALISSQEEVEEPSGRRWIVPGARVAADNVFAMLPERSKIWTEDSQIRRAAGEHVDVHNQIPHFAKGGTVVRGRTSWFGGPRDGMSGPTTAAGMPVSRPGVAIRPGAGYESGRPFLRGYWDVRIGSGRAVLQQTDIGPHQRTGRRIDVTYTGLPKLGYNERNFPTDKIGTAIYLGKSANAKRTSKAAADAASKAGAAPTVNDRTVSVTERVRLNASTTRARDAISSGLTAGLDIGSNYSRRNLRELGNPYLGTLREELDAARDSYTRTRDITIPGTGRASKRSSSSRAAASGASRGIKAGGGWGGTENVAMGLIRGLVGGQRVSYKRSASNPLSLKNPGSDHSTAARNAFAVDIAPGSGSIFHAIAKRAGIGARMGSWNKFNDRPLKGFRTQLLWHAPDGSHKDHVHLGVRRLRRGGLVRAFAGGGTVGSTTGGAPTGRVGTRVDSVLKSASDRNLKVLDRTLGRLAEDRLLGLQEYLAQQANRAGDAQTRERVKTALKQVSMEVGYRIARTAELAGRRLDRITGRVEDVGADLARRGIDPDSLIGRGETLAGTQRGAQDAQAEVYRLEQERAKVLRDTKNASTEARKAALDPIEQALTAAREAAKGFGDQVREALEALARDTPRLQAEENAARLDLRGSLAALTGSRDDDRQVAADREAEAQRVFRQAEAIYKQTGTAGAGAWFAEAASKLAEATESLRSFDEQRRDEILDYDTAVARLSESIEDDIAAERRREQVAQQRFDLAQQQLAQGDESARARATQAANDLKAAQDSVKALTENTSAMQEATDATKSLADLTRQLLELRQRTAAGEAADRASLDRSLNRTGTGELGPRIMRDRATPGLPGRWNY